MTKPARTKVLASLFIVASIAVLLLGYRSIAPFVAIPSVFILGFTPFKSGNLFKVILLLSFLSIGITNDFPFSGFPPALVFAPMLWIILMSRTWFFDRLYLNKFLLLEALAIHIVVAGFVISGILTGYDWIHWISAGIPFALYFFFSFVMYKDRADAAKLVQESKAETKVGNKAPDFTLPDQHGNPVTLSSILKQQHALLIFVRGDWCPTCHVMLRGYFKNKEQFAEKNIRVVGIGPDPAGVNKEIMSRIDPASIMLADEEQATGVLYSMALQENNPVTKSLYKNGIPLPASFLVHQNGKIIFSSRSEVAAEILQPDKIFDVLKQLS